MTSYVVHHERDEAETPVAFLEVIDGRITKATRPDGKKGLPSSIGVGSVVWTSRGIPLSIYTRYNRGLVLVEKKAEQEPVAKTVYKITTEQTQEEAGFVIVDDDTGTVEGYSGDVPPVGFIAGQTIDQFRETNRGYTFEAIAEKPVEERVEVDTTEQARLVGVAVGSALQASGVISKADEEQQIVYGWAYVTHDKNGILKDDKSGDFVDDVEEIQKSAIDFMLHHRASDLDHTNEKGGDVIESMVFTPEKKAAMGIPEGVLPNGWWIGVKCSDEQWAGYKSGRTAFSIHGSGTRKTAD